jgi:hypothetical protein
MTPSTTNTMATPMMIGMAFDEVPWRILASTNGSAPFAEAAARRSVVTSPFYPTRSGA